MKSYHAALAYAQSKLANLLFMRELARRLTNANADVVSAAAHPGSTPTELQRHSELMRSLGRIFAHSPADGALPTLYAATAPGVRGGDYFGPMFGVVGAPTRAFSSPYSRSKDLAGRLWEVSEDLTGVAFPSLRIDD
jgi:NAD(P)-dependent dehydrogenase (short-subunit alcohol dehydrogenase family)